MELAARLRAAAPTAATEVTGLLHIRKKNNAWVASIPVRSKVEPGDGQWQVLYQTQATNDLLAEKLVIVRSANHAGRYLYGRGAAADSPAEIGPDKLGTPLAGSEFCLADLGLEFLQWPKQTLLTNEMRRGRSCRVLESATSSPWDGGYVRVVSWVDIENDGILQAHAFDAQGALVKEFSLGDFKKIGGQWELRSMKIKNLKTGRSTELEFDLKSSSALLKSE